MTNRLSIGGSAVAIALLGIASVSEPASAQLLGTSVTGSINFGGDTTNYYDPANGFVPAGYLNDSGPTVTIANPAVEFGFQDVDNQDTANFTNSRLTVTDVVFGNAANWTQVFTDSAFTSLTKVSDTFDNGGVTGVLSGDTITLTWAGTSAPETNTAVFDVGNAATTPEPGAYALLASAGLSAAGCLLRRRRKSAARA